MKILLNKIIFFIQHPSVFVDKIGYFVLHPGVTLKNRLEIKRLKQIRGPNFDDNIKSDLPIDVIFPTVGKDLPVLEKMVESVRKHVKHPIGEIFIIAPKGQDIENVCTKMGCKFVDENTLLPLTVKDIKYRHDGTNRAGWLFQQLLKYAGDQLGKNEYFLITESDTVFIRPRVFEYQGKTIMQVSEDAPHMPYYRAYKQLTGETALPIYNFTSHHSLFKKQRLSALKNHIEKHSGKKWYEAYIDTIDESQGSCVSDYETYGQYVFKHYAPDIMLEHFNNLSLSRSELSKIEELEQKFKDKYKVISFHSYNE